jgi:hypothetical protein
MRCEEFGEHLTAFSLGELSGAFEAQARAHASGCRACAAVLLGERQLVRALRRSAAPAPVQVRRRVQVVLGARPSRGRRLGTWVAVTGLVVAVAVAAGLLARPVAGRLRRPAATVPAAAPAEPFASAWAAFAAARLPLQPNGPAVAEPLISPGRAELLVPLDLYVTDEGRLRLAGLAATAVEYRGRAGRLAVLHWRTAGRGPRTGPTDLEPRRTRWGRAYGRWWSDGQVVSMVVGALPPTLFGQAAGRVRWAETRP